jgi:hypothetical protein
VARADVRGERLFCFFLRKLEIVEFGSDLMGSKLIVEFWDLKPIIIVGY